jgi:hypothetical protein
VGAETGEPIDLELAWGQGHLWLTLTR